MFSGAIPALVTPFRDGAFDAPAFKRLVDWQIKEGTSALVPCGTTGESPTLGFDEHYQVIDSCIQAAAGRVPVIAGRSEEHTSELQSLMRISYAVFCLKKKKKKKDNACQRSIITIRSHSTATNY